MTFLPGCKPGPGRQKKPKGSLDPADVIKLCRMESDACIKTLALIRDDTNQTGNVRVAAAIGLLDRANGRPSQQVEVKSEIPFVLMGALPASSAAEWLSQSREAGVDVPHDQAYDPSVPTEH